MKILSVNKFYFLKGGSERYFFNLKKLLEDNGHEVIPFSMKEERNFYSDYEEHFVKNIDYNNLNFLGKIKESLKIIYSWEAKSRIDKLVSLTKPDIAHLHIFQHQISPSILPVLKRNNIPIIYTIHDLKLICPNYSMFSNGRICEKCKFNKYFQCLKNRCVKDSYLGSLVNTVEMYIHRILNIYKKNISIYITVSEFYRNKLIEYGFDANKIITIPNFVFLNERDIDYESNDYFVYFGRISKEKGLLTLIRAMKFVKNDKLIIIGEGPFKDEVMRFIYQNQINNIIFTGYLNLDKIFKIIKKSKFIIVPSEWYENCPFSILESFSNGKPVIGSNIGGIPELIDNGVDGLLFEMGNWEDLLKKINILSNSKRVLIEMGKNARKKILKKFSPIIHYNRIISVYEKVLNKY